MERRVSRLRVVVWLFAAFVVAAILVLGGALVIADRSRGPAGPGVDQIVETHAHQHWQLTLQDRGVPEARARRLFIEFYDLMQPLAEVGYEVFGHALKPRQDLPSWMHMFPVWWSPLDTPRQVTPGSFLRDVPPKKDGSKELLKLARDRGLIDDFLTVRRFRGAMRDPSGRDDDRYLFRGEEIAIATLLGAVYVDGVESGDEALAVRASQALIDAAVVFAEMDPGHSGSAAFLMQTRHWLLRHTIELGLMTPSLARSLLDETEPMDPAERRISAARLSIVEELQWIAVGDMTDWTDGPFYGVDGRVRLLPAFLSVFRAVPARGNSSLTLPRIGFELRHATLEELAEHLDEYAEACEIYFASSRADRSVDMLRVTPPPAQSGVVFPVGKESLWLGMVRHRDRMDEIELLQHTTTIALAIEVYRGEHGGPPASLEDLVPGVLTALPRNTWNNGGDWLYTLDSKSPLGYKLTIPDTIGPYNEGVLPGEWPQQMKSLALQDSEFFVMPSAPYDFGP